MLQGLLWGDERERTVELLGTTDLAQFLNLFNGLQIPDNAALVYGFEGYRTHRVGVPIDPVSLQNADLAALTAQLDVRVFDGLRRAQAMMDLGHVTRMSTTLDPAEMTLDPLFVLNDPPTYPSSAPPNR